MLPPSFSNMVPFYKQVLGFTMELKTQSNFKTTGLLQPWQTLCKIFSKCLTTCVTGWDQPPLQIMQMLYCFVNIIHVDYVELLWEGLYYSLHHPTSSIPYPRFTKIISQPTESTHGTHRTTSTPRSPNPDKEVAESSAPRRSTMIRLRLRERRSTRLTPPALVPTVDKANEMILQDTLQVRKVFMSYELINFAQSAPKKGARGQAFQLALIREVEASEQLSQGTIKAQPGADPLTIETYQKSLDFEELSEQMEEKLMSGKLWNRLKEKMLEEIRKEPVVEKIPIACFPRFDMLLGAIKFLRLLCLVAWWCAGYGCLPTCGSAILFAVQSAILLLFVATNILTVSFLY
ncbi:hypothetical protein Tco_1434604, partial [Tanacetum coccineum]